MDVPPLACGVIRCGPWLPGSNGAVCFSRTLSSEAQLGLSPCRTQVKVPLVTALASHPRSSAVARRFLCSRHDGPNYVEARRTQGSKECAPDPAAKNWIAWPNSHAGCRLTASPTDRGCRVSTPTTIFPFVGLMHLSGRIIPKRISRIQRYCYAMPVRQTIEVSSRLRLATVLLVGVLLSTDSSSR